MKNIREILFTKRGRAVNSTSFIKKNIRSNNPDFEPGALYRQN